jgi:hypothetical protein
MRQNSKLRRNTSEVNMAKCLKKPPWFVAAHTTSGCVGIIITLHCLLLSLYFGTTRSCLKRVGQNLHKSTAVKLRWRWNEMLVRIKHWRGVCPVWYDVGWSMQEWQLSLWPNMEPPWLPLDTRWHPKVTQSSPGSSYWHVCFSYGS